MRISEFIANNAEPIIAEWEDFARSCPAGPALDWRELRNNIGGLLKFIVEDLERRRTDEAMASKPGPPPACGKTEADFHAEQRFAKGFDTLEMISEFRALRASITRLWLQQAEPVTLAELRDLARFNEAIDELLAESVTRYMDKDRRGRSLFLGTLVHDIRNPLNAVVQSAQVLEMLAADDPRRGRMFAQIQRSAGRIGELVSQLIDAVRVRLGKPLPLARAPMDLAEAAGLVVEELRIAHPDRTILFSASEKVDGEWDAGRISQIVSNLAGNAVKYGAPGAPVSVSVTGDPDEAVISVHNEGAPIAPGDLPMVFDPLTRGRGKVREDPDRASLGLGLFITRQIVLAHGGSISVTSTAEKGTTFTARLPRQAPAGVDEMTGSIPAVAPPAGPDSHPSH